MVSMGAKRKKTGVKTRFTNTKGEKITVMKSGEKFRNGVSEGGGVETKNIGGKDVQYRSVMGKETGTTRQVRVGSGADAKYDTEGLYQGKGAETSRYSTQNRPRATSNGKTGVSDLIDRSKAMIEQTKAEGNKPFKGSAYDTGIEPTVMSDATIREDVIPEINAKINKLSETGQYYDNNGNLHNADGTVVDNNAVETSADPRQAEVDALTQSANEDNQMIFDTLDSLMTQTDQNTAQEIRAIKASYNVREKQLEEINRREQLSEDTSLLLGGSSRYTSSASGISAGFLRTGIMELAALDAEEMSAISAAKSAQAEQKYNIAAKKLEYIEKLRKEKTDKATEIANMIAEDNKAMRAKMEKQTVESAIVDLFRQGITDPGEIQNYLNYRDDGSPTGGFIDLATINSTLGIINPGADLKGTSSDYQTYKMMQSQGDIPDDWTFFDFKTAVKNAGGTGGGGAADDFTDQEKRKLEQQFGADWKNTSSRKDQLDYLYASGGGEGESMFTDTQLAKGAANAGVPLEEFMRINDDQKNEYINGRLQDLAPDINGILMSIDPDDETDKKEAYEMIRSIIESAGFDPEDYQGGRFLEGNEDLSMSDSLYLAFQASRA
jgi:hypothetical protein